MAIPLRFQAPHALGAGVLRVVEFLLCFRPLLVAEVAGVH